MGNTACRANRGVAGLLRYDAFRTVKLLVMFSSQRVSNNAQRLVSIQVSSLGRGGAGDRACRRACSGANCICLEAGISKFADAAAIRARRAAMLASAAKRVSSSVGFARATLGTILEGIVAKEQVRSCQKNV